MTGARSHPHVPVVAAAVARQGRLVDRLLSHPLLFSHSRNKIAGATLAARALGEVAGALGNRPKLARGGPRR